MSLVSPDAEFLLMAVLLSLVSLAIWVEKSSWGRKLSAALVILLGGAVLSNLGIIPKSAPLYTTMNNFFVPVAIPMFLLRADVRKSIRESGRVLVIFLIAAVGTIVGSLLAFQIVDLGADSERITGVLTASYIGGGVNFVLLPKHSGCKIPQSMWQHCRPIQSAQSCISRYWSRFRQSPSSVAYYRSASRSLWASLLRNARRRVQTGAMIRSMSSARQMGWRLV